MGEKEGLLLRASRLFDLPADALAGAPRVEMIGDGELRMGPHRGILAYGPRRSIFPAAAWWWWCGAGAWSCGP